ncbi:hypothetical protein L1987_75089 [Smallanthus sonchifolius]|uniref:Uncharacterized protein n=1 Tax=Smallanthus sonchifolius TaxID=185202 RepID=A0ACB9A8V9_9ASTR|nr:hypothetical protein L1987_75089 [Smallanthus sonchifolius]
MYSNPQRNVHSKPLISQSILVPNPTVSCHESVAQATSDSSPSGSATSFHSACYVVRDNIDTDQIIPAEYLMLVPSKPDEYKKLGSYALIGLPENSVATGEIYPLESDVVTIELEKSLLINHTTGKEYTLKPIGDAGPRNYQSTLYISNLSSSLDHVTVFIVHLHRPFLLLRFHLQIQQPTITSLNSISSYKVSVPCECEHEQDSSSDYLFI